MTRSVIAAATDPKISPTGLYGFYFGRDLPGHGIWFRGCYLE